MRTLAPICLALALTACATPPPEAEWTAPPIAVTVDHAPGTVLTGAVAESEPSPGTDAIALHASVLWVRSLPMDGLVPVGAGSRLVVVSGEPVPLPPTLDLGRPVWVGDGESAGRLRAWVETHAPGDALEVSFVTMILAPRVTAKLSLGAGATDPFLRFDAGAERPRAAVASGDELAVLEATPGDEWQPLALVFGDGQRADGSWLVLVWRGAAAPSPASVGDALAAAAEKAELAAAEGEGWSASGLESLRWQAARNALRTAKPRPALVYLAGELVAPLTLDLALAADDSLLRALLDSLGSSSELDGWRLESSSWGVLAARSQAAELDAELAAVMLRHAGEAGRSPSVLLGFVQRSKDAEEFEAQLVAENRIALEDRDPAARVRAHDWLCRQGIQVAGYDPLAERAARRAALAAAAAAREQAEGGDAR